MKTRYRKNKRINSDEKKTSPIMDPKISSCEMEENQLDQDEKDETQIQCNSVSSSNLDEKEIENILGDSRDSEDLFGDFVEPGRNLNNAPTTSQINKVLNNPTSKFQNKKTVAVKIRKHPRILNNKNESKKQVKQKIIKKCSVKVKRHVLETKANVENVQNNERILKSTRNRQNTLKTLQQNKIQALKKCEGPKKNEKEVEPLHKFFNHSRKLTSNLSKLKMTDRLIETKKIKPKNNIKSGKKSSIFDFSASQSSPSNSDDPTKEIVKDLIKAGKVEVVKYKKGSGRLKTKFKYKKSPKIKPSKIVLVSETKPKSNNSKKAKEVHFDINENIESDMDMVYDNHFDNESIHEEEKRSVTNSFSGLARHAIQNRAAQSPYSLLMSNPKQIKNKKVLLALAKSFVRRSEEMKKNKKIISKSNGTINNSSKIQIGCASPWRVEENMPAFFNFSRNSDNLPSFSSDVINPPSPKGNKKEKQQLSRSTTRNLSLTKSFNNSNIENMQPSFEKSNLIETNPKKGKLYRSPLKQINVNDIINLPLLAYNNSTPMHKPAVFQPFSPLKTVNNQKSLFNESKKENENQMAEFEISNLFGFEQDLGEEDVANTTINIKNSKKNLHNKLKRLKRLVPNKKRKISNEESKPTRFTLSKARPIFADPTQNLNQKNIKEMLCSTVNKGHKNVTFLFGNENENSTILDSSSENGEKENENQEHVIEPGLFEDESSPLKVNTTIRTYERPKRKCPKVRHNFVVFDLSDSDEERPKKKPRHLHNKEPKRNKELTSFYNDFNSMCAEVESYDLVVE